MNAGNRNRAKRIRVQDGGHVDIVRHGGMGDLIMIMPVLKAMAKRLDISFHVDAKWDNLFTMFKHSYHVSKKNRNLRIPYFNLNGVIDYLPYCTQKHRIDLFADEVRRYLLDDFEIINREINLNPVRDINIPKKLRRYWDSGRPCVAVCPAAVAPIRSWDAWLPLCELLVKQDWTVFLLADRLLDTSNTKISKDRLVNLTAKLTLREFIQVMWHIDRVISVDSGPFHLAYACNKPVVGIFGPIDGRKRAPFGDNKVYKILQSGRGCEYYPCWDWQTGSCVGQSYYKQCMRNITPRRVMSAFEEMT